MEVGAIRVAEDSDYRRIKNMCLGLDDSFNTDDASSPKSSNDSPTKTSTNGKWQTQHDSPDLSVWIKFDKSVSDMYCIRVRSVFKNIQLATLYDVLMDPGFRKVWDPMMIEGYDLCHLSPNTDIGYYALRCPPPIKNRDYVLLRSFLDLRKEIYVISYSVNHRQIPPKKNFIRGLTYLTAYYATANENGNGCTLYYIGQSDPKGKLPSWVVNKVSTFFAPRFVRKLQKCCLKYPEWKKKNNPKSKPWLYPEQISTPRLDQNDVLAIAEVVRAPSVNEEAAQEDIKATQELTAASADE